MMRFRLMRRVLCFLLGLMLVVPALAEGVQFSLRAALGSTIFDESSVPSEYQDLLLGLSALLDAAQVEGTLAFDAGSFQLDAALHLGSGRTASSTALTLYGTSSHWGLRSSLLGETELMINCASLLPFGQKAADYLGLPLDRAALLTPFPHLAALETALTALAPLFPNEPGKTILSRKEADALVNELVRLCDEDPALNRYLVATGLYRTAKRCAKAYFAVPELIVSKLMVRRSENSLTWSSGLLTLLNIQRKDNRITLTFNMPPMASLSAEIALKDGLLTGSADLSLDGMSMNASLTLPADWSRELLPIELYVEAVTPQAPEGVLIHLTGQRSGDELTLQLLHPDTTEPLLTVSGTLSPFDAPPLPAWSSADLTGVDVLSVNSDSLQALLKEVRWPLLNGLLELVAAAPAEAVQSLMDAAEDLGVLDLLTDALAGGSGY